MENKCQKIEVIFKSSSIFKLDTIQYLYRRYEGILNQTSPDRTPSY